MIKNILVFSQIIFQFVCKMLIITHSSYKSNLWTFSKYQEVTPTANDPNSTKLKFVSPNDFQNLHDLADRYSCRYGCGQMLHIIKSKYRLGNT